MPENKGKIKPRSEDVAGGGTAGNGKAAPPRKMVPPDGGWGWVVVIAFALNYFMSIPMLQSFGLIFKDSFARMNISATDCTTILSVNSALSFGLGLANGPLLRRFSYRKVAIGGGFMLFAGISLTSIATTFTEFIIYYSVITAAGFCFVGAAFSLAMSTYFLKHRGRATGLAMAGTGLGPILTPLLISHLLDEYAVQGTVLIMGGLVLHSIAAALLLQPVKWHMKPEPLEDEEEKWYELKVKDKKGVLAKTDGTQRNPEDLEEVDSMLPNDTHSRSIQIPKRQRTTTMSSVEHDLDSQSIYGFDAPLVTPSVTERSYRRASEASIFDTRRRYARSVSQEVQLPKTYWWTSAETVNLGSSYKIFDERSLYVHLESDHEVPTNNNVTSPAVKHKGVVASCINRAFVGIANFFYLDLLKDPIYVNIMMGMSAAIFAEINFSLLTPFILNDFKFETKQVATVMSVVAGVDIIFRFCVPFIAERFKLHPRVMYLFSLVLLMSSRTLFLFFDSYTAIIGIAVFLGVAKGVRTVYMTLVLPTYVPLDKLSGASGLQMLTNGLLFTAGGPLMGLIRDYSGSYVYCIYFMNGMTLYTILTWLLELTITRKGFQGHA